MSAAMSQGRAEFRKAKEEQEASRSRLRLGLRLVALGGSVLLLQCAFWLLQGHWIPCDLQAICSWLGARHVVSAWPQAQPLIDLALTCPLTALPVLAGFGVTWAGITGLEHATASLADMPQFES
jgi:hypothetical protein